MIDYNYILHVCLFLNVLALIYQRLPSMLAVVSFRGLSSNNKSNNGSGSNNGGNNNATGSPRKSLVLGRDNSPSGGAKQQHYRRGQLFFRSQSSSAAAAADQNHYKDNHKTVMMNGGGGEDGILNHDEDEEEGRKNNINSNNNNTGAGSLLLLRPNKKKTDETNADDSFPDDNNDQPQDDDEPLHGDHHQHGNGSTTTTTDMMMMMTRMDSTGDKNHTTTNTNTMDTTDNHHHNKNNINPTNSISTTTTTTSLHTNSKTKKHMTMKARHQRLLYRIYLPVYLLATAADWLQGPYKYAVYSAYGYDQRAISILFVAGFGSGMSLGSVVGGWADHLGRKKMVLVYCATYALSCLAKHCRLFGVLLLGRVLGGIATSLLFSVFDSWLIKTHALHGIDQTPYLAQSFSVANFGSSTVAIVAGLLANAVVEQQQQQQQSVLSSSSSSSSALRAVKSVAKNHPVVNNNNHHHHHHKSSPRPLFPRAARQWHKVEQEMFPNTVVGTNNNGISTPSSNTMILPPTTLSDKRWKTAWIYQGGGIAAFDLALVPLLLCFILALLLWEENYGSNETQNNNNNNRTMTTSTTESNNIDLTNEEGIELLGNSNGMDMNGSHDGNNNNNNNNTVSNGSPKKASARSNNNNNKQNKTMLFHSLREASVTIWRSADIFKLCCVTSFFEGAMYVFVLLWTPVLRGLHDCHHHQDNHHPDNNVRTLDHHSSSSSPSHDDHDDDDGPPLGIVFATFMVCCMLGTSVFSILSTKMGMKPSRILVLVLTLSALSCLVISQTALSASAAASVTSHHDGFDNDDDDSDMNHLLSYGAMLLFEVCIGAYYPAMSTVKGSIIPETQRSAIYSVFRLPMNLVVLLNLCSNLDSPQAFGLCFTMLGLATMMQLRVKG